MNEINLTDEFMLAYKKALLKVLLKRKIISEDELQVCLDTLEGKNRKC